MWLSFMPYALIPAIVLLVFSTLHTGKQGALEVGVYFGGAALLVQIFLRQISAMRESMSYAQQLNRANTLLESLATTDPLTELPNHRALLSMLDQELERSLRYEHSCSLLFLDIDHFKKINDTYGHFAGDAVLRETAQRLRSNVRPYDQVGRYGGEEFLVVLPNCDLEQAAVQADRMRTRLAAHGMSVDGADIRVSASFGVTVSDGTEKSPDYFVRVADEALYQAKAKGRNCVCTLTFAESGLASV